jgi:hypothetical protein
MTLGQRALSDAPTIAMDLAWSRESRRLNKSEFRYGHRHHVPALNPSRLRPHFPPYKSDLDEAA